MLGISRSVRRKLLATLIAGAGVILVYDATVIDSRQIRLGEALPEALPLAAGSQARFVATAYCKGQTTRSGVAVTAGIAASDPRLLPEGSVVQVTVPDEGDAPEGFDGIYTVLDTGPKVKGRHVDLYVWSCHEALAFGRRDITLTVLRLGWSNKNTAPGIK